MNPDFFPGKKRQREKKLIGSDVSRSGPAEKTINYAMDGLLTFFPVLGHPIVICCIRGPRGADREKKSVAGKRVNSPEAAGNRGNPQKNK